MLLRLHLLIALCCFIAGTPVVLGDGTSKPIEQLQVGDIVLSREEATGRTAPRRVQDTLTYQADQTLVLHFDNGSIIETTANHPFYVEHKGFVPAGSLAIGNSIVTRAGPGAVVQAINVKTQASKVYNLTIEDFHTFFVGKAQNALWVHNAGDGGCLEGPHAQNDDPAPGDIDFQQGERRVPATQLRFVHNAVDDGIYEGVRGKDDAVQEIGVCNQIANPNDNGATFIGLKKADGLTVAKGVRVEEGKTLKEGVWQEPSVSSNQNVPSTDPNAEAKNAAKRYEYWGTNRNRPLLKVDENALNEFNAYVKIGTYGRLRDAEIPQIQAFIKFLQENPNWRGTLRIVIAHPRGEGPCEESCKNVIRWFNQVSQYRDRARVIGIGEHPAPFDGMDKPPVTFN